jgi:predicted Zn-dependent peptidase
LVAFIGSQSDKMPTAMKEFKKLLDKMSNVPIQFQNSKESTLKQIASDRIVRDNIFWQYYSNKKLGIDYDYRKNILEAVKTRTIEQFEQEFSKLVSNKKFTTVLMGDKSMMNLDQIKEFGEIEEINTQQIFGY